jgi:hypothetical protein
MKEIPLTRGFFVQVDDEDFERLNTHRWYASITYNRVYASRDTKKDGVRIREKMHRIIMNAPSELEVDHINGNGLDNRKENLRLVTHRQNHQNRNTSKSSKYPGVARIPKTGYYRAKIQERGINHDLGNYKSEEVAATVYKVACAVLQECGIK